MRGVRQSAHRASPGGPARRRIHRGDLADAGAIDAALAAEAGTRWFHSPRCRWSATACARRCSNLSENVGNGLRLIDACIRHDVKRFVAVLDRRPVRAARADPIDETARIDPGSPYGESKFMLERSLLWADRVHGLRSAILRYFNAAGADPAAGWARITARRRICCRW